MEERTFRILAKEQRSLPVRLSPDELREKGRQAGALSFEIESIDAQIEGLKSQSKGLAASSEAKERQRREVERALRTEVEERRVEVHIEADLRTGLVREVRTDTGEILRERAMTADEAQGVMFEPDPAVGDVNEQQPPRRRGRQLPPSPDAP